MNGPLLQEIVPTQLGHAQVGTALPHYLCSRGVRPFPAAGLFLSPTEPGFAGSFARSACVTRLTLVVLLNKSLGDEGRIVAVITYAEVVVYRQANPVCGVVNSPHPTFAPGAW